MDDLASVFRSVTLLVAALGLAWAVGRWAIARRRKASLLGKLPTVVKAAPASAEAPAPGADSPLAAVHAAIGPLAPLYQVASLPSEIEAHPAMREAVRLLAEEAYDDEMLLNLAFGEHAALRCAAYRAIEERGRQFTAADRLLTAIPTLSPWFLHFALRALSACAPAERRLVGEVLVEFCRAPGSRWLESPNTYAGLRAFVLARRDAGQDLSFAPGQLRLIEQESLKEDLRALLRRIGRDVTGPMWRQVASPEDEEETAAAGGAPGQVGALSPWPSLQSLGRVWDRVPTAPGRRLLDVPAQAERVARLLRSLDAVPPRSCLLVGEAGVGKRATVEALARQLLDRKWRILEAGHTDMIANQKYVGQFEGRLQTYLQLLRPPRHLWYVPDFGLLRTTGVHDQSPTGALHLLLPHIERGEVRIVGTLTPSAYESLLRSVPGLRGVFEVIRVEPLDGPATQALARRWLGEEDEDGDGDAPAPAAESAAEASPARPPLPQPESDRVLEEAWLLAEQFLGDRAAPGNLLQLLAQTRRRLSYAGDRTSFGRADLIATLAELTGLPPALLDDRQRIDLPALRRFFRDRILGQDEAVDCLVQRITMMKAGLTDPGRPQGVFLFAGPTGTGKTEIAKVLAEYLFGSPERLIRVDMSEFNVPGSAARLLEAGRQDAEGRRSLASRVRQQPFAVVLLDEFEKSARDVWDLFLQVADDGRLTDQNGDTVDFRHTILILTSNLGGVIRGEAGLGFSRGAELFRPQEVERAIAATFRKEFLNRLDRTVVFRPFTRETMRELLQLEIRKAGRRRGLRHRDWATILDDSAVEFLLERGFTADLGARPLRRAVERHLLEPLAATMAQGRTPSGDRFLYVHREGDRLVTEFIDPDADPGAPASGAGAGAGAGERSGAAERPGTAEPAPAAGEASGPLTSRDVLLDPRGGPRELDGLRACCERLTARVESEPWRQRKQEGLAAMSRGDFWESEERFAVLGRVENIDRVESGLESAAALLERLAGPSGPRGRAAAAAVRAAPRDLVQKLAGNLFLLEAAVAALDAGEGWEAYLLVDAGAETGQRQEETEQWARRLAGMYEQWARRRRMKREVLAENGGHGNQPWRQVCAISGYAAHALLAAESGLHVWEEPDPRRDGSFRRRQALVRVVPQPEKPAPDPAAAAREALALLAAPAPDRFRIVRYYREEPAPLVRDRLRGWRSGRLQRVLEGGFDVMGSAP